MDFAQDILPVHIYCKQFWETRYRGKYIQITKKFISMVYQNIFEIGSPYMSDRARMSLLKVVDWFTPRDCTFIRVFYAYSIPH